MATFSKKAYEAISGQLRDSIADALENSEERYRAGAHFYLGNLVINLAAMFEADNRAFDKERFIRDVYGEGGDHEKS